MAHTSTSSASCCRYGRERACCISRGASDSWCISRRQVKAAPHPSRAVTRRACAHACSTSARLRQCGDGCGSLPWRSRGCCTHPSAAAHGLLQGLPLRALPAGRGESRRGATPALPARSPLARQRQATHPDDAGGARGAARSTASSGAASRGQTARTTRRTRGSCSAGCATLWRATWSAAGRRLTSRPPRCSTGALRARCGVARCARRALEKCGVARGARGANTCTRARRARLPGWRSTHNVGGTPFPFPRALFEKFVRENDGACAAADTRRRSNDAV
jgi:hypothetical protein